MRESDAEQRTKQIDDETCNERERREMNAAFRESVHNDSFINWRYWVEQMPQLTAGEAARLMCALDPDLFADLEHRPNTNDPSGRCRNAEKLQRLAERQGKQTATPQSWLAWADEQGIKVHDGFRLEVESLTARQAKVEHGSIDTRTTSSPASMEFSDSEAGSITTTRMSQAARNEMLTAKRNRQAGGRYVMSEVAQILQDTYPELNATEILKRMQTDFYDRNIVVRSRQTEIGHLPGATLRPHEDWMFPDDIRAMLAHWKWGREFPFTPQDTAPAQTETPVPVAVVASVALPKQRVQESRILELLKDQGYEPLKLSQRKPGKPGPKAEIRTLALNEPALFTKSSFEKAWERLRNDGAVAGAD